MGTISDSYEQTRLSFSFFFFFQYRLTSFYCTSQILHFVVFFFYKLKFCGNFQSRKLAQFSNFPTAFAHFISL